MNEKTGRLLLTAAALMLLSGVLCGFLGLWIYAALLGVGALGCLVSAWNFKGSNDRKS